MTQLKQGRDPNPHTLTHTSCLSRWIVLNGDGRNHGCIKGLFKNLPWEHHLLFLQHGNNWPQRYLQEAKPENKSIRVSPSEISQAKLRSFNPQPQSSGHSKSTVLSHWALRWFIVAAIAKDIKFVKLTWSYWNQWSQKQQSLTSGTFAILDFLEVCNVCN